MQIINKKGSPFEGAPIILLSAFVPMIRTETSITQNKIHQ